MHHNQNRYTAIVNQYTRSEQILGQMTIDEAKAAAQSGGYSEISLAVRNVKDQWNTYYYVRPSGSVIEGDWDCHLNER